MVYSRIWLTRPRSIFLYRIWSCKYTSQRLIWSLTNEVSIRAQEGRFGGVASKLDVALQVLQLTGQKGLGRSEHSRYVASAS